MTTTSIFNVTQIDQFLFGLKNLTGFVFIVYIQYDYNEILGVIVKVTDMISMFIHIITKLSKEFSSRLVICCNVSVLP